MNIRKKHKLFLLFTTLFLLQACGTTARHYKGEHRPISEVSILKTLDTREWDAGLIGIAEIKNEEDMQGYKNGKIFSGDNRYTVVKSEIQILPGKHAILAWCNKNKYVYKLHANPKKIIETEPGYTYYIRCESSKKFLMAVEAKVVRKFKTPTR